MYCNTIMVMCFTGSGTIIIIGSVVGVIVALIYVLVMVYYLKLKRNTKGN